MRRTLIVEWLGGSVARWLGGSVAWWLGGSVERIALSSVDYQLVLGVFSERVASR